MTAATATRYLTTAEVGERIQMSPDYVARQCAAGVIRGKRLGKTWRVSEEALGDFMNAGFAPATRPERSLSARQLRRKRSA